MILVTVRHWTGQNSWQPNVPVRRRFILQLAVALHSYGSTASRTEFLIDKAAHRLDIETNIAVFPSLILLSFPGTAEYNMSRNINDARSRKKSRKSSHKNGHISYVSRCWSNPAFRPQLATSTSSDSFQLLLSHLPDLCRLCIVCGYSSDFFWDVWMFINSTRTSGIFFGSLIYHFMDCPEVS